MAKVERGPVGIAWVVVSDAFGHFLWDDGWAMASHVALSALMALFPFLIFVASLAGFVGAEGVSVRVAGILFAVWPQDVAGPIADEVRRVLASEHRGLLTVSAVITVYLASNGIEAVRNALNRAYRVVDRRSIVFRRGQSIVLVVAGAAASLVLVLLAALGTTVLHDLLAVAPLLRPLDRALGPGAGRHRRPAAGGGAGGGPCLAAGRAAALAASVAGHRLHARRLVRRRLGIPHLPRQLLEHGSDLCRARRRVHRHLLPLHGGGGCSCSGRSSMPRSPACGTGRSARTDRRSNSS